MPTTPAAAPVSTRNSLFWQAVSRTSPSWQLNYWRRQLVPRIKSLQDELRSLDDYHLRKASLSLRFRAKSGESLESLLPEAFALVREAGRRALKMEHYDVQLLGGIAMFHEAIAEMETGEGKTLTASLAAYIYALPGKGVHVATVNDYLARRDALILKPLYELLGLSVGIVQSQMPQTSRRKAYECDITYGTAKEFGFDFLRDRLLLRESGQPLVRSPGSRMAPEPMTAGERPVQRGAFFALVDEADSILIDEARTPLIISSLPGEKERIAAACYQWASEVVEQFEEDDHYEYDHEMRTVDLTLEGRQLARSLPKPELMDGVGFVDVYEYVEQAIKVNREFTRDRHYIIREGEVVIVDESTGRLAEGRKWRSGIHQAIEAREKVEITVDTGQAARVTIQDFFLRYKHLGGMTGTASSSARELRSIYKLQVLPIPTNRPVQRKRLPDRIYGTAEAKWGAIVEEVKTIHATGRPVLIGTRSIDRSILLSELLHKAGITHQVLNAHQVEAEAEIVAHAGELGKVTVSTNMAGRGTDIKLGPGVRELGGLHVICTELHDSARIDRQLAGRCGRQGDPGTVVQYMALDDDILMSGLGPKKAKRLIAQGESATGPRSGYERLFLTAQNRVERRNFRGRKQLLYHEKQRKKMQAEMGQDPYLDTPD